MRERYEYRFVRTERGAWRRIAQSLSGAVGEAVRDAGGSIFGLFRGEIGWYTDEGALITAWPAGAAIPDAAAGIPGVLETTVHRLEATVRPEDPTPVSGPGVYAHRWFECLETDWSEFLELSTGAWPDFERAFGASILGFWRDLDATEIVRVLLLTRYPSLAAWERSRPYADEDVPQARAARERFVRRAELTRRTVVAVSRLVEGGSLPS